MVNLHCISTGLARDSTPGDKGAGQPGARVHTRNFQGGLKVRSVVSISFWGGYPVMASGDGELGVGTE